MTVYKRLKAEKGKGFFARLVEKFKR